MAYLIVYDNQGGEVARYHHSKIVCLSPGELSVTIHVDLRRAIARDIQPLDLGDNVTRLHKENDGKT